MDMFPLLLQAASAQAQPGLLETLFPFLLMIVVFYFLLIRPQQKKEKERRAMVDAVGRGDTVVTQGGVIGKVTKVHDDGEVDLEIASGVNIRVVKSFVIDVRVKNAKGGKAANDGAPAPATKDTSAKKKDKAKS